MRVTLVPCGRGRWTPMHLDYSGEQLLPLDLAAGDIVVIAGRRWRVRSVTT